MTTTTDSAVLPTSPAFSVLAAATATHGTGRDGDIALPKLPGFVESAFSPLAYEVAATCLTACHGDGDRTAVALVSLAGDTTTADLASSRMVSGRVHNPLLFMQATANSVLGHMSREFGITGQMFSLSTLADPLTELLAMAELLLEEPELDRVLVLGVELGVASAWPPCTVNWPPSTPSTARVRCRSFPPPPDWRRPCCSGGPETAGHRRFRSGPPQRRPVDSAASRPCSSWPPPTPRRESPIPMLISRQERARICSDTELGAGNVLARLAAYERPLDEVVLRVDGTWRAPDGSCPAQLTLGELCEVVETYAGWYAAQGVRPRDPVALHPTPAPSSR